MGKALVMVVRYVQRVAPAAVEDNAPGVADVGETGGDDDAAEGGNENSDHWAGVDGAFA